MSAPDLKIAHDVAFARLLGSLSTGDNGWWELVLALAQGRPARITFEPGETARDMNAIGHVFGVLARTCQLTAEIGKIPVDRRELANRVTALVENTRKEDAVWRAEFVLAAQSGRAAACQACGAMSISPQVGGGACPHCRAALHPEAFERAKSAADDMRSEGGAVNEVATWF